MVAGFARNQDIVDFLVVEVAQRSLDQRAFLIDEGRGLRLQRHVAHGFPHPDQVFEIALDLGLGARGAGGAQDDPHALGHVEILHHFLQARTILRGGDLAADTAAARGVGHQDRVAARQRQIGRQRGALVATLFLHDLHQHHLAALDDLLNLVLAARAERTFGHLFQHVVAANGFDDFFLGILAFIVIIVRLVADRRSNLLGLRRDGVLRARMFGIDCVIGVGGVFARLLCVCPRVMKFPCLARPFIELGCGRFVDGGGSGFLDRGRNRRLGLQSRDRQVVVTAALIMIGAGVRIMGVMLMRFVVMRFVVMRFVVMGLVVLSLVILRLVILGFRIGVVIGLVLPIRLRSLRRIGAGALDDFAADAVAMTAAAGVAMARTPSVGTVFALFLGLAMGAFVGLDQGLTVGDRNLIIVGMDFAEGEEAVTIATIFDEGGLQRRLYARDFGEIDVAAQLLALGGLEIKLFDAIAFDHDNPGLFRVGGIDQHFVGHFVTLGGGGRGLP